MKFPGLPIFLALCLAAPAVPARAEKAQLLESGSFEWPPVTNRRPRSKGADVSKAPMNAEWMRFRDQVGKEGGEVVIGLTNEISRTGRQSMFVEFNKVTKQRVVAELVSDLLPILPNQSYRVAISGRMDKTRPLTLAGRVPFLKLRVDWFQADRETQTGDSVWKLQPMPGPQKRPPFFVSSKWTPYWADVQSPEDAAFIKISWSWETPATEGETDGVIFFDDAVLEGEAPPKPDPDAEMAEEEEEEEEEAPEEEAPEEDAAPAEPKKAKPAAPASAAPTAPAAGTGTKAAEKPAAVKPATTPSPKKPTP